MNQFCTKKKIAAKDDLISKPDAFNSFKRYTWAIDWNIVTYFIVAICIYIFVSFYKYSLYRTINLKVAL